MFRSWCLMAGIVCLACPAALPAQSLSMHDAMQSAIRRDGVARDAALDVERGRAAARQAAASLLPSVALRGTAVRRTVNPSAFGIPGLPAEATDPFSILDGRASARVPVIDMAARSRWRAAREEVAALTAIGIGAADAAALRGATAYLHLARAEVVTRARNDDVALASELVRISRERVNAGLAPNIDETRAAARMAESEALRAESVGEVQRARIALEDVLDDSTLMSLPLGDSLGALAAPDSMSEADAIALAAVRRAELVAADAYVTAARTRARAVGAEWIPSVNLLGDVGTIGRASDALVGTWQVGVEVSLPLLDGFSRHARAQAASVALQQAELGRREVARAIGIEVRAAFAALASLEVRERAAREQVRLAELEAEQARTRFAAGVAGNAVVVLALSGLSRARVALADALTARAAARIAIRASTGSLGRR